MAIELNDEQLAALRKLVETEYDDQDNDDDAMFWSEIHEQLGGEPLHEEDDA